MTTTEEKGTISQSAAGSSCDTANGRRHWLTRHSGLLLVAALAATGLAFAGSQNWITLTSLLPLLYALPCMAMMLMCMKHMADCRRRETAPAEVANDPSDIGNVR